MSRRIVLIAVAAAVGIAALWFVLLWKPQSSKLDAAASRRTEAENANAELVLRVSELEDLERRKPQLEAQRDELEAAVPGTADLGGFLLQVDEVADQAGVNFTSIAPTPPALGESGPPTVVAINISVDGGYFEVLDYLNRLDKLSRLVVTDNLTMTGAQDAESGEQRVNATIAARLFTTEAPPAEDGAVAPTDGATTTTAPGGAGATTTTTAGG